MSVELTVGLPVYNAMPFLPEAVSSVLGQTYTGFHILIIDDGSTDGSSEYLKSIRDPRVRILRQENRGLTSTLNRLLQEVQTPWLARMDADDISYGHRIETTMSYIRQHPGAGMFHSRADYFPRRRSLGQFRATEASPEVARHMTCEGYLLRVCHPTVTINVAKALSVGGYRFDLHVEDIDLWWRLALEFDVTFIPDKLIAFRQNQGSVSSKNLEKQAINTLYVQYLLLSHVWQRSPLPHADIAPLLSDFLDADQLQMKRHIRSLNMSIAQKQYGRAAAYGFKALLSAPKPLSQRLAYELGVGRELPLGISPLRFEEQKHRLWPR